MKVGGQEHMYLETNCARAVPRDNKNIDVTVGSHDASYAQVLIRRGILLYMMEANTAKRL